MKINAEFDKAVIVHSPQIPWIDSPMAGVCRRPLDRVGNEIARATSIVRYAPGSKFSRHRHEGGEEFFVLQGVFQDEHGDYPQGSYVRNPPNSSHTPRSDEGCEIFVKLWQFDLRDRTNVCIDINVANYDASIDHPGVSVVPLHSDSIETVSFQNWEAGVQADLVWPDGAELLLISGELKIDDTTLVSQSWMRMPVESKVRAISSSEGARFWVKSGHMRRVQDEIDRLPIEM